MPTQATGWGTDAADQPLKPMNFERRDLRPDDVAIKITYAGICHSDLHICRDDWSNTEYPTIPGHEIVGTVTAVGGEVRAIGGTSKVGSGAHFIAEIDESDPLFARIHCDIAVVTNIEDDHVAHDGDTKPNYHANLEALHGAFQAFARQAAKVVYCADWPGLVEVPLVASASALSTGGRAR